MDRDAMLLRIKCGKLKKGLKENADRCDNH